MVHAPAVKIAQNGPIQQRIVFSLLGGIYKLSFLHRLNPFETFTSYISYAIDTYLCYQ